MEGNDRVDQRIETDRLAELVGEKHAVLEQMRDLARRQTELIANREMTRLLSVLAAKQTMLLELRRVERQLEPFRAQAPEGRQWRSPQDRQVCRQVAEECETLLSEILLVEKQSESELAQRRDSVAVQLDGVRSSAQAAQAYTSSAQPVHHSFDLSSDTQ